MDTISGTGTVLWHDELVRRARMGDAWLRTMAVNTCRSWYRQSVPWPESLEETPALAQVDDPNPGPLEILLARERQREWRRALLGLPDANRLAFLMHVWGDYSYAEIAAFTEVPVTTVEGRIHRAKAQLRRLLRSHAGDLLGEAYPRWRGKDVQND